MNTRNRGFPTADLVRSGGVMARAAVDRHYRDDCGCRTCRRLRRRAVRRVVSTERIKP